MTKSNEEVFRDELIDALERELVGPGLPPHDYEGNPDQPYIEVLEESPTQRYSAGVLFPQQQTINETDDQSDSAGPEFLEPIDEELPTVPLEGDPTVEPKLEGVSGDSLTDAYDQTVRLANEFYPSAIGLTCLCDSLQVRLQALMSQWASVLPSEWGGFGKPPELRPLMYPAGSEPRPEWGESAWSTPTSMRNVDVDPQCIVEVIQQYPNPKR